MHLELYLPIQCWRQTRRLQDLCIKKMNVWLKMRDFVPYVAISCQYVGYIEND